MNKVAKPILSVVFCKARADLDRFDYATQKWLEKGPPIPVNQYVGSGGHDNEDLQKAQVFGFSKKAKARLAAYADKRLYEIRPVMLVEICDKKKKKP